MILTSTHISVQIFYMCNKYKQVNKRCTVTLHRYMKMFHWTYTYLSFPFILYIYLNYDKIRFYRMTYQSPCYLEMSLLKRKNKENLKIKANYTKIRPLHYKNPIYTLILMLLICTITINKLIKDALFHFIGI